MSELFPDILRAIISTTANVVLMISFLQPKYSKKITGLTMLGILAVDLGSAIYCYVIGNLTMLSKLDTVLFAVLCFLVRPLFKDNFMQWLFSYITVQNITDIVVILSFVISRKMPYPVYSNSFIRFILFGICIYGLKRYVGRLYHQSVEHWKAYFAVAFAIYLTFTYYVIFTDDIIEMLTEQAMPLLLVVFMSISAYGSIFYSLKMLKQEYALKEENLCIQADKEYLSLSANAMMERIKLMDEAVVQNRLDAHDRRHFNNTLLELLEQGETEVARDILRQQAQAHPSMRATRNYCENVAVNAAITHYVQMAEDAGIRTTIALDIPKEISADSLELAMVLSNLLENAIHACMALEKKEKTYIHFHSYNMGRLLIEIENSCSSDTTLDENKMPYTTVEGHGTGSRSVSAFVKQYNCELVYHVENDVFRVRLLI